MIQRCSKMETLSTHRKKKGSLFPTMIRAQAGSKRWTTYFSEIISYHESRKNIHKFCIEKRKQVSFDPIFVECKGLDSFEFVLLQCANFQQLSCIMWNHHFPLLSLRSLTTLSASNINSSPSPENSNVISNVEAKKHQHYCKR